MSFSVEENPDYGGWPVYWKEIDTFNDKYNGRGMILFSLPAKSATDGNVRLPHKLGIGFLPNKVLPEDLNGHLVQGPGVSIIMPDKSEQVVSLVFSPKHGYFFRMQKDRELSEDIVDVRDIPVNGSQIIAFDESRDAEAFLAVGGFEHGFVILNIYADGDIRPMADLQERPVCLSPDANTEIIRSIDHVFVPKLDQ